MTTRTALLLSLVASHAVLAARAVGQDAAPIQDNSFLVEEAYNQEAGVVQHAATFARSWESGAWVSTFSQEWPVHSVRHQLSFTLPAQPAGLGDAALNYRLQLVGDGASRIAVSPRVSLLLPSGSASRGLGAGRPSLQFMLPASTVLGRGFVAHWNAGVAFTPHAHAQGEAGARASLTSWTAAQSVVWLARPTFNVLVETVWARTQAVAAPGVTRASDALVVSPGMRWSHDFKGGLQVVPGIAFPLGVGPSSGERALFLYLSFEHPFGHRPRG